MAQDMVDAAHIGEEFQERTKYRRGGWERGAAWTNTVPPCKDYPPALPRVALPEPDVDGGPDLWTVIRRRRSVRSYAARPVDMKALSQLLWAAQGTTAEVRGYRFRAAPSAGALYPVESYVAVHNVRSLEPGLYHYAIRDHALIRLRSGDLRGQLAAAALGQEMCAEAAVVLIWTAVVGRSAAKYAQRAYRYIYLDAGHIAQNVALACVGLGLGSCQIGALLDDELNAMLDVDGHEETIIYMTAVGPVA